MSLLRPARDDTSRKIDLTITGDQASRLDRLREAARERGQVVDLSAALRPHLDRLLAEGERALGIGADTAAASPKPARGRPRSAPPAGSPPQGTGLTPAAE